MKEHSLLSVGPYRGGCRILAFLFFCVLGAAGPGGAGIAGAQERGVVTCNKCHGDREFLVGKAPTREGEAALFVPDTVLRGTRHSGLACAECHPGYDEGYPHRTTRIAVSCSSCHPAEGLEWEGSVHAPNVAEAGDAPGCVRCHGSHRVLGAEDRAAPTHPLNVASLCGSCHADPEIVGTYFMAPEKAQARTAVEEYYQTVHGSALTEAGLVVSATCNDCHGAHKILPSDSAESSIHRSKIAETCGTCHQGVLETYMGSAHGAAYRTGQTTPEGEPAPVCVECHTSHEIVRADQPQWYLGVVEECGSCHERLYETYFETYHGKATGLGYELAAQCAECHTAHAMLPATDPESSVYPTNLVETCGQCHPNANQNFVEYYAHGDPRNRQEYPRLFWPWLFMTSLLAGVFLFFGTHTMLWLGRLAIDRVRGGRATDAAGDGPTEEAR